MSFVSNYIVCASVFEEEAFTNLCKSLTASRNDNSTPVTSEYCVHNGKRMEAGVMLFALNYVDKKDFLEAVRNISWKEGLESVQVFYMSPNNTLFEDITDWETVDYC